MIIPIKVSTIIKYVRDYRLTCDARTMFDFLVVKQIDFGLSKAWRHSIAQIREETGIKRQSQEKAINLFVTIGFLRQGTDYFNGNPYKSFFIDFSVLAKEDVLSKIIRPETSTFSEYKQMFEAVAKEQEKERKKADKPLSKHQQQQQLREKERQEEAVSELLKDLNNVWRQRIEMYNNGELTDTRPNRAKIYSQLPLGKNGRNLAAKLLNLYDSNTIRNAFVAYADKCLTEGIKPRDVILYFLTYHDGEFSVVEEMINYHIANYSRPNCE